MWSNFACSNRGKGSKRVRHLLGRRYIVLQDPMRHTEGQFEGLLGGRYAKMYYLALYGGDSDPVPNSFQGYGCE